jgi:hypothetical protein
MVLRRALYAAILAQSSALNFCAHTAYARRAIPQLLLVGYFG